ncbi:MULTISPECIES: hypothetical protein [Roseateles]|uniref:Solute-binding protein family 3/N-terminal domain-containing protein n=1 Tax=Pelomonas aquatica TaxID=431058 RepID=A0ABU1Z4J4_9BURK|nr:MULTISPECIES: hypothetical protein [Roseateles]KQY81864.1 hypothetical protein ASD35_08775 [Pelomonas sp. Root1444]MDR7295533.1 hypothetical protein [Pelomonas aquatica]
MLQRRGLLMGMAALGTGPAWAQDLVVTLRAPDSTKDARNSYVRDAVQLALDKTRASDGSYRLQLSVPMNKRRALLEAASQTASNFLVVTGPEAGRAAGLAPVLFPIHLGVNGYRVCFVHAPRQAAVRAAGSLEAVARLRHVQGRDWPDVAILRANGFAVTEVNSYESLFQLVEVGRADLFCRSVLEVGEELRAHAGVAGLALDDSLLLAYELPQYLYTHPANKAAIDRIARGLRRAFADGSLQALLRRYLQPSLAALKLPQRRLFTLVTPPAAVVEMNDKPFQIDPRRIEP